MQILKKFSDVVWHVSWSVTGNILAVSGGDNKVSTNQDFYDLQLTRVTSTATIFFSFPSFTVVFSCYIS